MNKGQVLQVPAEKNSITDLLL